jgi:RHS repeat-associated protein
VTPAGQASTTYTYAYNVHDSVSLLLDSSGNAKTSYAYRPYGDMDATLTGGEPDKNNPFNPYRYTAKRFDSGSQTIDMRARRFATDTSKFLQPDQFNNSLANLSLSTDPITQNRYSLAGGNPLSYIEWDGHMVMADGGGGNDPSPSPTTTSSSVGGGEATWWNPFSWHWDAAGTALGEGTSRYEGPDAYHVALGVAGDIDALFGAVYSMSPPGITNSLTRQADRDPWFHPLASLDKALGGNMSASTEYQTGSTTGTVAAMLLPGGAGKKEVVAQVARWTWKDVISGFTRHATNQGISRDSHGVSYAAIKDAVENPVLAVTDVATRVATWKGANAVLVINNDTGRVITMLALNHLGWRF